MTQTTQPHSIVIIGSGPAGLTAALYAARADFAPLVLAGTQPGGQLTTTTEVENYPGFPEGILGPDLMEKFRKQAERFGAIVRQEAVTKVDFSGAVHKVYVHDMLYEARAVIIATGATAMWLRLPSETRLRGRGVSSCATCDGAFFRGKEVAVVGGGDTALEEALFLTRFAKKVTLIHRRDTLRASKIMQERALKQPKITFLWNSQVIEVLGDQKVSGVKLLDTKTGETREFGCEGLFVAIGHKPNTDIFKGQLSLDAKGYLMPKNDTESGIPGVFIAGDVSDVRYRQAVTAAGAGCKAAMDAEKYLENFEGKS